MNTASIPNKLEEALGYLERGWALIPIDNDKRPYMDLLPKNRQGKAEWTPLARYPASEQDVRRWLEADPECNIGIITGQPSGGLIVADFDRKPSKKLQIPVTPRVVTARMFHSYFHSDVPVACHDFPYGEIKGDGGYCVAPPSRHPSGHIYHWHELLSPDDADIAECPDWVYKTKTRDHPKKICEASREYPLLASQETGFKGLELGAWDANEDFVLAACSLLDIPVHTPDDIGKPFECILPGHDENHPSASLYRREDGLIVYRDWHRRSGAEWYYLAEIRASQAYGQAVKLRSPEMATWHIRLIIEAGYAEPADVNAIELPASEDWALKKVYAGFLLLLGCKWLHTPEAPTCFSWRFAAIWCGLSERYAGKAIKQLLDMDIIRIVGKQNGFAVFLPGGYS